MHSITNDAGPALTHPANKPNQKFFFNVVSHMTTPIEPTPSKKRRWWIPLLTLGLPFVIMGLRSLFVKFDLFPQSWFILQSAAPLTLLLGLVVCAVWFFALARFSAALRVGGLAIITVAFGSAVYCIKRVDFDGSMKPSFIYRWEKTPEELFAEHRAQAGDAVPIADVTLAATDSPGFRGVQGDGRMAGIALADSWEAKQPVVKWVHPLMDGLAGIAVAGNSFITIEQRDANETIVCYDRETGLQRWVTGYPAKFSQTPNMGGGGPRTTPIVHEGRIYTLGGAGDLVCLDGSKGTLIWQTNILSDNDAKNVEWGLSGSPLIVGNVIVAMAGTAGAVGYDLATGKRVWSGTPHTSAYASPFLATLAGKEWIVVFDSVGVSGLESTTGKPLWTHAWKTPMNMNSAQPIVLGPDSFFVSSELSNGGAAVQLQKTETGWTTKELWKSRAIAARFASPIFTEGFIYGLSGGYLVCVDAATGKEKWKEGEYGNGQILLANGKLVIVTEKGNVALVACDSNEHRELGNIEVLKSRTWNMPALAGKSLFMRSHREMARVDLP